MNRRRALSLMLMASGLSACGGRKQDGKPVLRVGHFPNITHAQAVIANQLSRAGKGWFEERIGAEVQWFIYNAGPSAIEAFFTDAIDLSYIGPSPVLNGYIKSGGDEIRVVSGATKGGASLVVRAEGGPKAPAEFRGRKIATPQLGNTQDVACRVWLRKQGFTVTQTGGDVQVIPTANPDQLSLFQQQKLDGVWTVEPWVSRLEMEAGGRVFLEQKADFATVVAASTKALQEKAELVKKFVAAHVELTQWVAEHPAEAKETFRAGFKAITKGEISEKLVDHAWPRLVFNAEVTQAEFESSLAEGQSVELLPAKAPKLDRLLALQK